MTKQTEDDPRRLAMISKIVSARQLARELDDHMTDYLLEVSLREAIMPLQGEVPPGVVLERLSAEPRR